MKKGKRAKRAVFQITFTIHPFFTVRLHVMLLFTQIISFFTLFYTSYDTFLFTAPFALFALPYHKPLKIRDLHHSPNSKKEGQ